MARYFPMVEENAVRREFGKPFSVERARRRRAETRRLFDGIDLAGRSVLDVGAGHCIIEAFATRDAPDVRFDALDFAPEFEAAARDAIARLAGDPARVRFVTGDFYEIAAMKADGRLHPSYDLVLLYETLHHSTRKADLLAGFHAVMTAETRMLVVEPVLPPLFRDRAYAASQWARDLGYIEDPVGKGEYLAAFDRAGFDAERMGLFDTREDGTARGLRRLVPGPVREAYRARVYPLAHAVSMRFVLRSRAPRGGPAR